MKKTKISFEEFTKKLNTIFGEGSYIVEDSPEIENGEIVTLKLIYVKNKHVASWQTGDGWIF